MAEVIRGICLIQGVGTRYLFNLGSRGDTRYLLNSRSRDDSSSRGDSNHSGDEGGIGDTSNLITFGGKR